MDAPRGANARSPAIAPRIGTIGHPANPARSSGRTAARRRQSRASVATEGCDASEAEEAEEAASSPAPSSSSRGGSHGTSSWSESARSSPSPPLAASRFHALGTIRGMIASSASPSSVRRFSAPFLANAASRAVSAPPAPSWSSPPPFSSPVVLTSTRRSPAFRMRRTSSTLAGTIMSAAPGAPRARTTPCDPSASGTRGRPSSAAADPAASSSTISERQYSRSVNARALGRGSRGGFPLSKARTPAGVTRRGANPPGAACSARHESASGGASARGSPSAQSASASSGFRSSSGSGNVASRGVIHRPPSARVYSTLRSTIAAHVARTTPPHGSGGRPRGSNARYAATLPSVSAARSKSRAYAGATTRSSRL